MGVVGYSKTPVNFYKATWSHTVFSHHPDRPEFPILVNFMYKGADKSLARPTSRCILFDGENTSFDASLVIYINSTSIPPAGLGGRAV
jgi:hypothetical protein